MSTQHPGVRRILWCYCGLPLTSCCWLWSRNAEVRFHAWQAFYLGVVYIGALAIMSIIEVASGFVLTTLGRSSEIFAPVVTALVILLWISAVLRVLAGRPGRLPVIGRWAARRV